MEAVRTLRANLKLSGKPCGWCQAPLQLGDDAAVCTACEAAHHHGCWDTKAGCATHGCSSAPLRRLDVAPAPAAALAPGTMSCTGCGLVLAIGVPLCPACRAITSPDGIYRGPRINAPGAVASLVLGIVGLFACQIILGPLAIWQASKARYAMTSDPSLGGEGLATAGKILGVLDLVVFALAVLYNLSQMN